VARDKQSDQLYGRSIRRVFLGVVLVLLVGVFLLWRINNPRVEQLRMAVIDKVIPRFDWALVPVAKLSRMVSDFRSYTNIYEQNQELRRELQRLKGWREAALQLEQKNAKLLDLNKVRISPKLTYITGIVLADSGSPFRQSALINVGARDGVRDGWATMDGLGLVGRISGVGQSVSRVILLTDSSSSIPVTIEPSGQNAIMVGNNGTYPAIEFPETPQKIHAGDRVVSSGDAGVFPPGLLAGQVVLGRGGQFLVNLAADYGQLEFMRVLRSRPAEKLGISDAIVGTRAGQGDKTTGGAGRGSGDGNGG